MPQIQVAEGKVDNHQAHQGTDNSPEQAEEPFPQEAVEDLSQLLELAAAMMD